ncbi:lactate utilization protein B [Porifericola rhodea]|uniref:lactate utilization protein B n=1 Tax=Porifericola rhodea TaxID=930972 RepID=UPI002666E963|nr:lactate utilization protein B [Porifericola rhodea]WKN33306.1 lactate utilization protein B [Porifericola rhodea]
MSHPHKAQEFIANENRVNWHDKSLWHVREKRDKAVNLFPEWEQLREKASQIKSHTLSRLDEYLEEFEKNAIANGVKVHWASDAIEHNDIVLSIFREHGVQRIVKSKSMLTEECHLNPFLEKHGIEVIDSDLGERIVQLAKEPPSHIVMPAIHKKRMEIDELFQKHLHTPPSHGDENILTAAAREHLRQKFMKADAALTGVNFGIAETGDFVVCTNEGNADMGVHLAPVQISSMGIEKLIPRYEDLGVFTRLLARSATGQHITTYTSQFRKPRAGTEMHLILVDNGRTVQLGREKYRRSLHCIRCGACMNTCPVYRRSGGHSYQSVIPGPIGSILSPGRDMKKYSSLPFASSLCGSCSDVCPVKINIHEQLYFWRQDITQATNEEPAKKISMKMTGWLFTKPKWFRKAGKFGRKALAKLPRWMVYNSMNVWGKHRELPEPPKESFQEWYQKNRKNNG